MNHGASERPTMKLDPTELLGLVAKTAGQERLRPTCQMPKVDLDNLLHDPATSIAAPPTSTLPPTPPTPPTPTITAATPAPVAAARIPVIVASCLTTIAAALGVFALL